MTVAPRRSLLLAPTLAVCGALAAGCGGSRPRAPRPHHGAGRVAQAVCDAARTAAAGHLRGVVAVRVTEADPSNLECVVTGGGMRADVVAQASSQAWAEFDTTSAHQSQVFGSGGVHDPAQFPIPVTGVGEVAVWIAAQGELVATNGTPTRGGSYVTVTVSGAHAPTVRLRALARAIARATLAAAPRGPNPGQ